MLAIDLRSLSTSLVLLLGCTKLDRQHCRPSLQDPCCHCLQGSGSMVLQCRFLRYKEDTRSNRQGGLLHLHWAEQMWMEGLHGLRQHTELGAEFWELLE